MLNVTHLRGEQSQLRIHRGKIINEYGDFIDNDNAYEKAKKRRRERSR